MIVVDSSALVAILEQEPDADRFLQIIRDEPRRFASAVTVYETGIVIGARRGWDAAANAMTLVDALGVEIVPFAEPYISAALDAYRRYGKGVHPRARLNLGDCAAYALAMSLDAPLLFKGSDFAETDVGKGLRSCERSRMLLRFIRATLADGPTDGPAMKSASAQSQPDEYAKVQQLADMGINHLHLRFMGEIDGETAHISRDSAELFAKEVMPRFVEARPSP